VAQEVKGRKIGHACVIETSMMMYLRPSVVREHALADGDLLPPRYGDAEHKDIKDFAYYSELSRNGAFEGAPDATAEIGKKLTNLALERAANFVRRFADVEIPPGIPTV
jgi:creatinine amidohydrolase/Fe(II)-dependent formamide hydrolase-like protein